MGNSAIISGLRGSHPYQSATAIRFEKKHGFVTALVLCASLLALHGQARAADNAQTRYQAEVAACNNGTSNEDRATCLKEAAAAKGEAKKNNLTDGRGSLHSNALDRCNALPSDDKAACVERIKGQGETEGSVGSGGILRELVVPDTPK